MRQRTTVLALQKGGDLLVQRVLIVRRMERPRDRPAIGAADVLRDLVAKRPLAEGSEARAQRGKVAAGACVLGAKGVDVAKQALVDERREPIQLQKGVLQRRRREEEIAAVFRGPTDPLANLVARPVGVVELVSLVDDDQIPFDRFKLFTERVRVVQRHDQDGAAVQRVPRFAVHLGIQHDSRQAELLLDLQGPLLANGRRADHERAPPALRPVLTEDDFRLDRLSEAHFVGKNHPVG